MSYLYKAAPLIPAVTHAFIRPFSLFLSLFFSLSLCLTVFFLYLSLALVLSFPSAFLLSIYLSLFLTFFSSTSLAVLLFIVYLSFIISVFRSISSFGSFSFSLLPFLPSCESEDGASRCCCRSVFLRGCVAAFCSRRSAGVGRPLCLCLQKRHQNIVLTFKVGYVERLSGSIQQKYIWIIPQKKQLTKKTRLHYLR